MPDTRTWSPWVCDETPFRPRSFTNLLMRLAWSAEMPAWMAMRWRAVPLAASSILPCLERLQRDLAADELLLEHLVRAPQAVLGRRVQDELLVAELDGRVGALEVEPGPRLAVGLVDGVADLLHVDLGDDVEGRHGATILPGCGAPRGRGMASPARRARRPRRREVSSRLAGRCPSGQREQTVNLPASPTKVRILPGPPTHRALGPWCRPRRRPARRRRGERPGLRGAHLPRGPLSLQCRYERRPAGRRLQPDRVGRDRTDTPGRGPRSWAYREGPPHPPAARARRRRRLWRPPWTGSRRGTRPCAGAGPSAPSCPPTSSRARGR